MKRKEYMIAVLSIGLAMLVTGCSSEQPTNEPVVSTEVETEVAESGYKDIKVEKSYPALVIKEGDFISDLDTMKVSTIVIPVDTYVTVTDTVEFNRVVVDYYKVKTDEGSIGYLEGKNLDFNVALEEDYADSLTEVEGGDGEETTETVAEVPTEEVPNNGVPESAFKQYQMFTNTACNVRSQPNKEGTLLGTMTLNTEITITGVDGDWSQFSYDGSIAYVKSSLLSKTKTEVKQPSTSKPANSSSSNGGTTNNSGSSDASGSGQSDNSGQQGAGIAGGRPTVGEQGGGTSADHAGDGNYTGDTSNIIMH